MKLRSWLAHTAALFLLAFGIAGAQSSPSGPFQIEEATIDDGHAAMTAGALACRELVQGYLDRIDAYDKKSPNLNTIQTINPRALELADELDASFDLLVSLARSTASRCSSRIKSRRVICRRAMVPCSSRTSSRKETRPSS